MPTAQAIIDSALRRLGVIGSGESPDATESQDALQSLNDMIASWGLDRLFIYAESAESFVLSGKQSYTIGSGGDFNTTRPNKILSAYVSRDGVDYPIDVLASREQYERVPYKATNSIPESLYYEAGFPLGTIHIYPVGDATYTLHLTLQQPLSSFPDLTTSVTFPPGYERALKANLAVELAPEYGRTVPAELVATAQESVAAIKRINSRVPVMHLDTDIPGVARAYNINSDAW